MQYASIIRAIVLVSGMLSNGAHSSVVYNRAQVQRGADVFMLHCAGCHSLRYVRQVRLSDDLGRMPSGYTPILSALSAVQAHNWFGRVPPDLSLVAHEKGQAWLFNYLNGFYPDKQRPFGVNNYIIPDVVMPDVFYGINYTEKQGVIQDLLAFLEYTSSPERGLSYVIGAGVLVFLLLCLILSFLSK